MKTIDENNIIYEGEALNALVIDAKTESVELKKMELQEFISRANVKIIFAQEPFPFVLYGLHETDKPCFKMSLAPKFIFTQAIFVQTASEKGKYKLVDTNMIDPKLLSKGITFFKTAMFNPDSDIFKDQRNIKSDDSKPIQEMLWIHNDGKEVSDTNYFETIRSLNGKFAISIHERTMRLLLPISISGQYNHLVSEIGKIQSIAISQNRDKMWEIMFDDCSDAPLALHFTETSFLDFLPRFKWDDGWIDLYIYEKKDGKIEKTYGRKAYLRSINGKIPCLKPLGDLEK
jgi:hypothetical protein